MAIPALPLPLLTEFDSKLSNDGSIDPLGLYPPSEALATLLCPGVRERMKNPRFLTLMAVGSAVCTPLELDDSAPKEYAPPYQVFEWHTVEGLVRRANDEDLQGLPGILKAQQAVADGMHLSVGRYLKTASVFGFNGIYRPLARQLDIINDEHILGAFGAELVGIWEQENGLSGFLTGKDTEGAKWKRDLYLAMEKGLREGHANQKDNWKGWDFFARHLNHRRMGEQESKAIYQKLLNVDSEFRRPLLTYLTSSEGKRQWSESKSERNFHIQLKTHVSREFILLLDAILKYEAFARSLQNGFDHCMRHLAETRRREQVTELGKLKGVTDAAQLLPTKFALTAESLEIYGLSNRFVTTFECFANPMDPEDWVRTLFEFHRKIQKNKPPHGKKAWASLTQNGQECIVDPNFVNVDRFLPKFDDCYVNFYRTASLWSFCEMLGVL